MGYWKLNELYEIYPQIRHKLSSFLKLHRILKRKGLTAYNVEWFADAIEIGAIKLPDFQCEYQNLQNKVQTMQYQKQKLERDLQVIQRRIIQLADVEKLHEQNFDTLADNICDLQSQKHQLERFAFRFKKVIKSILS